MKRWLIVALVAIGALLIPATASAERLPNSAHGGDPFTAVLAGHGSGISQVTLNPGHNEVCWTVNVANLTAPVFASHIHKGGPGVNGDIVVPFFSFETPTSQTSFSGCTENVDRGLIDAIEADPAGYYVNVHTSCEGQPSTCGPSFPRSAVRGQLSHP